MCTATTKSVAGAHPQQTAAAGVQLQAQQTAADTQLQQTYSNSKQQQMRNQSRQKQDARTGKSDSTKQSNRAVRVDTDTRSYIT
jgi:hypothetical protein